MTGYRLKIVERSGTKLKDLLTTSNPWRGEDCGRPSCLLCTTKNRTERNTKQCCRKRNLVYEIWCHDCSDRMEKEIDDKGLDPDLAKKEKMLMKIPKYIGETSRLSCERSFEHQQSYKSINSSSFMMKHWLTSHEGEDLRKERYSMKVLRYTRSAF